MHAKGSGTDTSVEEQVQLRRVFRLLAFDTSLQRLNHKLEVKAGTCVPVFIVLLIVLLTLTKSELSFTQKLSEKMQGSSLQR